MREERRAAKRKEDGGGGEEGWKWVRGHGAPSLGRYLMDRIAGWLRCGAVGNYGTRSLTLRRRRPSHSRRRRFVPFALYPL